MDNQAMALEYQRMQYPCASDLLQLKTNAVDIWQCFHDGFNHCDLSACFNSLSRDEIERYERIAAVEAQRNFLVGHALVRGALSHYANISCDSWHFSSNEFGRPSIYWPRRHRNMHFSLSHTTGVAVLAVSLIREVGIDVEMVDRKEDIQGIAEGVFTQSEARAIACCPRETARDRFFDLWTLKEAYIKARGMGFSLRPDTFEFVGIEGEISLRCSPECDPAPERWQFHLSRTRDDLRVALAIGSRAVTHIRQFGWSAFSNERQTEKLKADLFFGS